MVSPAQLRVPVDWVTVPVVKVTLRELVAPLRVPVPMARVALAEFRVKSVPRVRV